MQAPHLVKLPKPGAIVISEEAAEWCFEEREEGGGGTSATGKKKRQWWRWHWACRSEELGASRGGGGGWMVGETMLSALAEESSPPSSCLQPRSLSDPPFEAITLSPGQAHQRISSHLHDTFTAPSTGAGPQPRLQTYREDTILNNI